MPYVSTVESIAEGQALLAGIEVVLDIKFGAEALTRLMPEIRELSNNDLLRAVLHGIKTANTPEELRQIWSA